MFRISRRLDYGLQLMTALANGPENQPQSTASLSERLTIPLPFLHQIAHTLMQAGLIKATPGPRGGLRLNRGAEKISVREIAEALEGPIALNPCVELTEEDCSRLNQQNTQIVWNQLQDSIIQMLDNVTLDMLTGSSETLPAYSLSMEQGVRQPRFSVN